jgi:UDP-N-acetylglucosamine--N-acetylmuramyl-(pentapeptide) pyrophosphoryl-undecaprenol N-acetylglucosamine transferase
MLAVGIAQSIGIISKFKPDLVFGSGGYASVAAVSAAWLSRKTVVLQEQNSVPGLANRLLAPMAKRVYLGFGKAEKYFKEGTPLLLTGNPLRRSIAPGPAEEARSTFGLSKDAPVLLVFGGSQGAITLNRAAAGYILARKGIQAIVQTGTSCFEEVKSLLKEAEGRVYVSPYIDEIDKAYSASDVALARAGALSVSELAAARLPSVLVPYPHSADDHQTLNAEVLVEAGGGVMIRDRDLDARTLAEAMDPIFDDESLRLRMRESLAKIPASSSAALIADDIEKLVHPDGTVGRQG